jgi:hypothetical protein
MRLDYSGTKIIQIFIVTNRFIILDHAVVRVTKVKITQLALYKC